MNRLSSVRCNFPKMPVGATQHTHAQYIIMTFVLIVLTLYFYVHSTTQTKPKTFSLLEAQE